MNESGLNDSDLDKLEELLRKSRENREKIARLISDNDRIAKETEEILKRRGHEADSKV
jgi:hypothetical protein